MPREPSVQRASRGGRDRPAGFDRWDLWFLGAVVLLAFFARVPRLTESLWYDEIAAWREYGIHGPRAIVTTYDDPANHIAHTLLSWCSVELFFDALGQETALRLPALLFSLGAVVAVHGLSRRAGSRRVALLAAAAAAGAPVAVLEGVEARGYSMMVFFAASSSWVFLEVCAARRIRGWLVYGVLCALGVWSHMMMVFVPVGHAAWLLWRAIVGREHGQLVRGVSGLLFAAGLTLVLYAPVLGDIIGIRRIFISIEGDEPSPFGSEGLHTLLQLGGSWSWWAALPGLILAAIGFAHAVRSVEIRRVVAASMLGLPIAFVAVAAADSWLYARFTLFVMPGVCLLIALGIDALWRRRKWAGLVAACLLAACYASDLAVRPAKQPLREAASFVVTRRDDGEGVLIVGLGHRVMDVYGRSLDPAYSLFHGEDLPEALEAGEPMWVIVMYPRSVPEDRYELLADRGYRLVRRFDGWVDWGNGDVLVYRRISRGEEVGVPPGQAPPRDGP